MAHDVEIPDPPRLHGPQDPGDYEAVEELPEETGDTYRREDLAAFLREGAWEAAFAEWVDDADVAESEFRVVLDRDLVDAFDFYWNPAAEDVGYRSPALPEDLPAAETETLETDDMERIEDELDALGRIVSEVLENDYIHREDDEFGYSWE